MSEVECKICRRYKQVSYDGICDDCEGAWEDYKASNPALITEQPDTPKARDAVIIKLRLQLAAVSAQLVEMTDSQKRCWSNWTLEAQTVKELEAENAALRADKERMDALELWNQRDYPGSQSIREQTDEAIDAAREAKQ